MKNIERWTIISRGHTIRVVIFQEEDTWGAQCLEYDIGTHAQTINYLKLRLMQLVGIEATISKERNGAPFAGIDPAPRFFFDMWDRAEPFVSRAPLWRRILRRVFPITYEALTENKS